MAFSLWSRDYRASSLQLGFPVTVIYRGYLHRPNAKTWTRDGGEYTLRDPIGRFRRIYGIRVLIYMPFRSFGRVWFTI